MLSAYAVRPVADAETRHRPARAEPTGTGKVTGCAERGRPLTGSFSIELSEAVVVKRIFEMFADDLSSTRIGKRGNKEIPRPRWSVERLDDPRRR